MDPHITFDEEVLAYMKQKGSTDITLRIRLGGG